MPYTSPIAILFTLMLAVATPGAAEDGRPDEAGRLFVVQGEVTEIAGAEMRLRAEGPVVAFTDRPDREVRLVDLAAFVADAWAESGDFRTEPPNASLIDETAGTIGVVELTDAWLSDGMLTFGFVAIEGALPSAGDRIALTIDVMHPTQY